MSSSGSDVSAESASPFTLVALAEETTRKLNTVWDDIGLHGTERQAALATLYDAVTAVFEDAVTGAEDEKKRMETQITQQLAETSEVCSAMGDADVARDDPALPLVRRLAFVQQIHDGAIKRRDERMAALQEQHEALHALWAELGTTELPERFASLGNDLTLARVADYMDEVSKAKQEHAERTQSVRTLAESVAAVWRELDEEPSSEFEQRIARCAAGTANELSVRPEVFGMLESKLRDLSSERDKRQEQRDALEQRLSETRAGLE